MPRYEEDPKLLCRGVLHRNRPVLQELLSKDVTDIRRQLGISYLKTELNHH